MLHWLKNDALFIIFFVVFACYLQNSIIPLSEFASGHLYGDTVAFMYVLMWGSHALFNNLLNYYDPPIFYPGHNMLPMTDGMELPVILLSPLWYIYKNPVILSNAAMLLSHLFALVATFYSIKIILPINRFLAAAFAIIFAASSDRFWHSVDHLNLIWSGVLPIVFAATWYAFNSTNKRSIIFLGLSLATSVYFSVYFFVLSGITILCAALAWLVTHLCLPKKKAVLHLIAGGLLGIALATPKLLVYYFASRGLEHNHNELAEAVTLSASLTGYLRPIIQENRFESRWYAILVSPGSLPYVQEDGQFIGFSMLLLLILESCRLFLTAIRRRFDMLDRLSISCLLLMIILILSSFGPNFQICGISPYRVLYYTYLQFSGFFRTPARLAFISHWLMIVCLAILGLKVLKLRFYEFAVVTLAILGITVFEHVPRTHNPFGLFTRNKLLTQMDNEDPTGREAFVSIGYDMYLYQALSSTPAWRPTVNGWFGGALADDFSRRYWNFADFPTTDTIAWLAKNNVPWVLVPDPSFQQQTKADDRLQYQSSDLGVELYRIKNPEQIILEYEKDRVIRRNYLRDLRSSAPPSVIWPATKIISADGGYGFSMQGNSAQYETQGENAISAFFALSKIMTPGLFDQIEVEYEILSGNSTHQTKLYWQTTTEPMNEKRGIAGLTKPIEGSATAWKTTFNVFQKIEWMRDDDLVRLRIDFTHFNSLQPVKMKIRRIEFLRKLEIPEIPYI